LCPTRSGQENDDEQPGEALRGCIGGLTNGQRTGRSLEPEREPPPDDMAKPDETTINNR